MTPIPIPGKSINFVCEYDQTGLPTGFANIDGERVQYFNPTIYNGPNPISPLTTISSDNVNPIYVALDAVYSTDSRILVSDTEDLDVFVSLVSQPKPFSPSFNWDDGTLWDSPGKTWS